MTLLDTYPQVFHDLALLAAPALAVALLPDGRHALTSGLDFHLRLWDLARGVHLKSWDSHGPLYDIQVIRDGQTALLAAVQGIVPWDLARWDLEQPNTLWSHSQINALAYCEATGELLGGGEDTTLHRWRLPSGEKLPRLAGHNISITALDTDRLGRRALSSDLYGALRLWDLENNTCLRAWTGHPDPVSAVDLSPDGRLALSAGQGGTITLWDLETFQAVSHVQDDYINAAALSPDQARAYVSGDGGMACWDLATGERIGHKPDMRVVAFSLSADENTLVALLKSNHLMAWRAR
jgi:WD40 repeat protein